MLCILKIFFCVACLPFIVERANESVAVHALGLVFLQFMAFVLLLLTLAWPCLAVSVLDLSDDGVVDVTVSWQRFEKI